MINQCAQNERCKKAYDSCLHELLSVGKDNCYIYPHWNTQLKPWERLRYCNAWYIETYNFIILQSYQTIVAVYDKKNNTFYSFQLFSYGIKTTTTSRQIRWFYNLISAKESVSNFFEYL